MKRNKHSLEEAKQIAIDRGGECLSYFYKNTETKMKWRCHENHEWEATLDSILNCNSWCPFCAKNNKIKYKNETKEQKKRRHCLYIRRYKEKHREKVLKQTTIYRNKNKEKLSYKANQWRARNLSRVAKTRREWLINNKSAKIADSIRSRIKHLVKSSSSKIDEALGCSYEDLRLYLESLWQPGMSWDNWSKDGWHIDHIKPLAAFNLEDPEQLKQACHYTNLQPLWAKDNLVKSDKYENISFL